MNEHKGTKAGNMRRTTKSCGRIFSSLLIALVVGLTTACATPRVWLAQKGQVLEWPSKKPIEGAVVVALWKGSIPIIPADSMSTCYHVESAAADAQGRYRLPAFTEGPGRVIDRHIMKTVYKAGYRESIDERGFYREKDGVHYLEKDERSVKERLEYLKRIEESTRCDVESERLKVRSSLIAELYEEAKEIASTKQDRRIVDSLLYVLESMEIGDEQALKNLVERRNNRGE